jgi:tetratricopeptide (TPR) repeat protein
MRRTIGMRIKNFSWRLGNRAWVGLALFATCSACNTNKELQQQYRLEKAYFRAQKMAEAILINPRIAPTKNFAEAIARYRQVVAAVDTTPANPRMIALLKMSLLQMAQLELLQQRVDKAVEIYQELLKRFSAEDDETTILARLALGLLYARNWQYQDAVSAYAGLLPNFSSHITPENPNAYFLSVPFQFARLNKFSLHDTLSRKAYEQATEAYRQIIAKWPDSKAGLLATNYSAALLADQGRWHDLEALIGRQISDKQDTAHLPEYLYWKGILLYKYLGQSGEAMQLFEELVENNPGHRIVPWANLETAKVLLAQQKREEARELLRLILAKHGGVAEVAAQARAEIAQSLEVEGRWDLAINEYRFLAKEYETSPAGLAAPFYIANYYTRQNETTLAETAYAEAISFYQEIIRKYPKSLVAGLAQEQIANCFLIQKKWDEAAAAASEVNKILDNNIGRVSTFLLLGNIYESSGQVKLAVKAYQEFIKEFPQHPLTGQLKEKVQRLMSS